MTAAMTFQTRVVIDHIRGTPSALAAANPVVGYGVFVMETDADRGKFGDGLTAYNDLPYFAGEATWASLSGKPASFTPSSHASTHGSAGADPITVAIGQVTGLQTALDGKQATGSYVLTTDSRLSDSREWSAATVTQAQAEAGTGTTRLAWTVQRVWQAIAAWWAASADKTKLDGVAVGATANSSDAHLLSRANHTGTQVASTISDFSTASVAAVTWTTLTGKPSFATVATTGSYTDLSNTPSAYTLPTASASVLGGVKIGSGISIDGSGGISASSGYTLPVASASVLGGIKIGSGLSIDGSGVVSAAGTYALPNATTTTLGGVIVGTGLAVSSGTVSVSYGTTSTTACAGNDSRLSDSRTPTGSAGGDLTGTYPNPTIANGAVTLAKTSGIQKTITSGSAAPTGGVSGDYYIQTAAAGQVTPATLSASANDYAPGNGDIYRLSASAAVNLTGWTAWTDGTLKMLVNVGSFAITLKHQSTSSSANNRFLTPTAGDYILLPGTFMLAYWDATDSRVRVS